MIYCTQCGEQLPDDSTFCTKCGAQVQRTAAQLEKLAGCPDDEGTTAKAAESPQSATPAEEATVALDTGEGALGDAADANAASANATCSTPAAEATGTNASENLTQAVSNAKRKAHRRVPVVVLIALAIVLAASAAFAAWYLYANANQHQAPVPVEDAAEPATNEPAEEQPAAEEPTPEEPEPAAEEEPAAQEEQPAEEEPQAATSYSVASTSLPVNLPTGTSTEWRYDTVVANPANDAVDAINTAIAVSLQADADTDATTELSIPSWYCEIRSIEMCYMNDSIVSFKDLRYDNATHTFGEFRLSGVTFDLKTGQAINPATLFGLDEAGLNAAIQNALSIYFASQGYQPTSSGYPSYLRTNTNTWMHFIDGSSKLYVTEQGLVMSLDPYDYNTTEGSATRSGKSVYIAVWDNANAGIIGTAASYSAFGGN